MGVVDVQSGAAAAVPEQPEANMSNKKGHVGSSKTSILIGASIGVLCLAAVMIGVLPDWKNEDQKTNDDGLTTTVSSARFQSSQGSFNVSVPLFSSDVTRGYENVEEAKVDFGEMAKFLLNGAIADNINLGIQAVALTPVMTEGGNMALGSVANAPSSSTPGKAVGDSATDFGTNNQESNVDQSDIAKSNGAFLFTAYGQYLLVLDVATGALLDEVEMTPIEYTPQEGCDVWQPYPIEEGILYPTDGAVNATTTDGAEGGANQTTSSAAQDAQMDMVINPCFYKPTPYIQALAIDGDRLTVVVSGYGQEYTQKMDTMPTIYEYLGTRILVYDINGGDLKLLSTKDVNGYFLNAFTVNGFTHVVTQAGVNT